MAGTQRNAPELPRELLEGFMRKMMISRKFEERVQQLFDQGLIHGTTHLGIGEEASAVGSVLALEPQDYILASHRGHNQVLAKGVEPKGLMAEMLGKATGICKGKGGSMHLSDMDKGLLGTNGILGSNAPIACGAGMSIRRRGEDRIVACFFGDGSSNLGAVHEAMNLASIWNLPVLFVLTNNTYAMSTHISRATRDIDLEKRAYPFAMPATTIDGNDLLQVYEVTKKARAYVVKHGPMLIVEDTYRISGHSKNDADLYRSQEEIEAWRERCPIQRLRNYLIENQFFTEQAIDEMERETTALIEAAVQYAKDSPDPALDSLLTDVYA